HRRDKARIHLLELRARPQPAPGIQFFVKGLKALKHARIHGSQIRHLCYHSNGLIDEPPMTELEQLRQEVAELRKALTERSSPSVPGFVVDDTPNLPALANNFELITDLTRYAEGLLEEKHVRKKYRFTEAVWTQLGHDEKFIEAVELERIRRV